MMKKNNIIVLNDMGGSVMNVSDIPSTLRAQSHQHEPVICFEPCIVKREGSDSRFVENVSGTLRANMGDNQPAVCYAIEGNVVDRVSAKNGKGWCEDVSPTLNTQDRHAVVYTIDALSSNSMKSNNPHSGIHETHVSKCLDTACLDSSCNQGGHMVCIALEGHGSRPSHMGNGYSDSGTMYTLNTIEQHSVCYPKCYQNVVGALCADDWRMISKQYIDQNKVVCYSVDCRNLSINEEKSGTLQAKSNGGFSYNYLNPILKENK